MNLIEYINAEKEDLDKFAEFWKEMNAVNVENFPSEMEPAEWDEQFIIYAEEKLND